MKHTIIIRNGEVYRLMPLREEDGCNPCEHCDLYDECFPDDSMRFVSLCLDDSNETWMWRFVHLVQWWNTSLEILVRESM